MVDNVPYVQGSAQAFVNYSLPKHFNCLSEQGAGGLEGHIGLPALQPAPCTLRSYMGTLYASIPGL